MPYVNRNRNSKALMESCVMNVQGADTKIIYYSVGALVDHDVGPYEYSNRSIS